MNLVTSYHIHVPSSRCFVKRNTVVLASYYAALTQFVKHPRSLIHQSTTAALCKTLAFVGSLLTVYYC